MQVMLGGGQQKMPAPHVEHGASLGSKRFRVSSCGFRGESPASQAAEVAVGAPGEL